MHRFQIELHFLPVRSPSNALQGPCVTLLATSRIQNPNTKTATAQGRWCSVSPSHHPTSAACPMTNTENTMDTAPTTMNGLRRPNRLVHRSLIWPTRGCTKSPESGPHSHMTLAHACGIPSCCTYGVSSDSCRAHPNWMPPATDATLSSCRSGTRSGGRALNRRCCWRWGRLASGFAILL